MPAYEHRQHAVFLSRRSRYIEKLFNLYFTFFIRYLKKKLGSQYDIQYEQSSVKCSRHWLATWPCQLDYALYLTPLTYQHVYFHSFYLLIVMIYLKDADAPLWQSSRRPASGTSKRIISHNALTILPLLLLINICQMSIHARNVVKGLL